MRSSMGFVTLKFLLVFLTVQAQQDSESCDADGTCSSSSTNPADDDKILPPKSTSSSTCQDTNPKCPELAAAGECENSPFTTLTQCKRSCKVCKDCTPDSEPEKCRRWAQQGECEKNTKWMMEHCENSCVCEPPCIDLNATCHFWAWAGECTLNQKYMKETCPKICGHCKSSPKMNKKEPPCVDEYDYCGHQAELGRCQATSGDWDMAQMVEFCPVSCNVCHIHLDHRDVDNVGIGVPQALHDTHSKNEDPWQVQRSRNKLKAAVKEIQDYMETTVAKEPYYKGFQSVCQLFHDKCAFLSHFMKSCEKDNQQEDPWLKYGCSAACGKCDKLISMMDPKCPPDSMNRLWTKSGDMTQFFRTLLSNPKVQESYQPIVWSKPNPTRTERRGGNPDINQGVPIVDDIWVVSLDNIASQEEINAMLRLANRMQWKPLDESKPEENSPRLATCDGTCVHTVAFSKVKQRLFELLQLPADHTTSSGFEFLHYRELDVDVTHHGYDIHELAKPYGVRLLTVLLFWNSPLLEGAHRIGRVTVPPLPGRVVLFPNVRDDVPNARDDRSTYTSMSLIKGAGAKDMSRFHIHQSSFKEVHEKGCQM